MSTEPLSLPHAKGSATSKAAAEQAAAKAPSVREIILAVLRRRGLCGATDDELERELGLSHQTVSARRRELVQAGFVIACGDSTRKTRHGRAATVWVTTGKTGEIIIPRKERASKPSKEAQQHTIKDLRRLYHNAKSMGVTLNDDFEKVAAYWAQLCKK